MALIDVVKCEVNDREFVYKFPSDDLRIGTQLVVYPAQTAFFVKGGKIYDEFQSGTHTLKSENIPLLNKLINLPFGKNSPFKAEVWFINQVSKLDLKWGTATPIDLTDPRYNVIVPVRAHGQYGIKIKEPRTFLETLIGNMASFTSTKIEEYFRGKVLSQLSTLITQKIVEKNISIFEINAHLMDMSDYCNVHLSNVFNKYGIEIIEFSFLSINVPKDDSSIVKLKNAIDTAAGLKITGLDFYKLQRSFDVMEAAAKNEGGGMINLGAGLGAGLGVGGQMGAIFTQTMSTGSTPPPLLRETPYFLYLNNQQQSGFSFQTIANLIAQGQVTADTLLWKQGMADWSKISTIQEFRNLFEGNPIPPPIPQNT
jgi:membrane protease subunit (stomatin/prohibitin family)